MLDRGDWIQTYTGNKFHILAPHTKDIDPLDIAHALSMICRYGGHAQQFYSVAEHCVLLSYAVPAEDALWALLHDAAEAYIGDMVRPLKRSQVMHPFREAEVVLMWRITERFGLPPGEPDIVREADSRILHDERAVLFGHQHEWESIAHLAPLGVQIHCWDPTTAKARYLRRLNELFKVDG